MKFRIGDRLKLKDDLKIGLLKQHNLPIFTDVREVTWVGIECVELNGTDALYLNNWLEFDEPIEQVKDDMIGETIEIVHQLFKDSKISVGDYSNLCWSLRCEPQVSDDKDAE